MPQITIVPQVNQAELNLNRLKQVTDALGLDHEVLIGYYLELQTSLSQQERERLDLIFQTDPCQFVEVIKKAHQLNLDALGPGQVEENAQKEFRRKVLHSNDIGQYLMRICENIDRVEAKFDEVIDAASKQFSMNNERNAEAICRGILKLLILND